MLFLGQFPMKIEHIPGETNVIADLLSRIPEYSGYVNGSLREPVDVEIPNQEFESPESSPESPPSLTAAPITLMRGKVLLETPVVRHRTPQKLKSDRIRRDQEATDIATSSVTDDIPVTPRHQSLHSISLTHRILFQSILTSTQTSFGTATRRTGSSPKP
jgi:hypothetical protein